MKQLVKFLDLPATDRGLLFRAGVLLALVRLGLWLLPFQTLRRWLSKSTPVATDVPVRENPAVSRVAWAVTLASRTIPRCNCLPQALVTRLLLNRGGYQNKLHIGVARGEDGRLQAHAWVESGGQIVIGDSGDLSRYTLLLPLEAGRQ